MTLQLADRSVKRSKGIIEDVLIKVDKFYFSVDFIVIDMEPVQNVGSHRGEGHRSILNFKLLSFLISELDFLL